MQSKESLQRNACDRCRGQKLRCVRLLNLDIDDCEGDAQQRSECCQRCKKAGAICINTLVRQRKVIRSDSERWPRDSAPQDSESVQQRFASDSEHNTTSTNIGLNGDTSKNTNSGTVQQLETSYQEAFRERPVKRRSTERFFGSPTLHQHLNGRNGGDPITGNAQLLRPVDTPPLSASSGSSSRINTAFAADRPDIGVRPIPDFAGQSDGSENIMGLFFDQDDQNHMKPELRTNPVVEHILTPMATKEDCMNCLSELSTRLLKDFSKTNFANLADILSFPPMSLKNTLGRVLESSQHFLEIVQFLNDYSSSGNMNPNSSAESECSYSEVWDENDFLTGLSTVYNESTVDATIGGSTISSTKNSRHPTPIVDMPTTLTILTCYMWLLQTYNAIFSRIHTSLSNHSQSLPPSMPCILPGLHIGGFNLDNHMDLQMEILIQVTSKRLEQIEETLGIDVISQSHEMNDIKTPMEPGILDTTAATALLEVMFRQDGYKSHSREKPRSAALVKQTMDDIRRLLISKRM
ncbi:hypothetical protein HYFRA_00012804 [Hymenoscyphus fraxineus]|uniref:Zn(2)-C6 fungal-type domain-containing protein n=1 Tax=Hymenoscyphus fraxineus TaxID=746836 RepID=A0A9N9L6C8_9HELO|nr:hypothetical protein HYFRA_00012804 [Hymenoscyphus fraxineus]